MNMSEKIAQNGYVATAAQVETLAHEHYVSHSATRASDGTYLRILVAGCQAKLGTKRRGPKARVEAQMTVVESVHKEYYAAILRGVTTEDIAPDTTLEQAEQTRRSLERNRRSTFARSSKATLALFVRELGDIRTLDLALVTKVSLRAAAKPVESENKFERQIVRAEGVLLRALERSGPELARPHLEGLIATLEERLEAMEAPQTRRERRVQRTRVGVPTFRPAAAGARAVSAPT